VLLFAEFDAYLEFGFHAVQNFGLLIFTQIGSLLEPLLDMVQTLLVQGFAKSLIFLILFGAMALAGCRPRGGCKVSQTLAKCLIFLFLLFSVGDATLLEFVVELPPGAFSAPTGTGH
jgi:hypothetical protein